MLVVEMPEVREVADFTAEELSLVLQLSYLILHQISDAITTHQYIQEGLYSILDVMN